MSYRIDYSDSRHCRFANDSKELIEILKSMKVGDVADIRKLYKSGVSDSVKEKYQKYLREG